MDSQLGDEPCMSQSFSWIVLNDKIQASQRQYDERPDHSRYQRRAWRHHWRGLISWCNCLKAVASQPLVWTIEVCSRCECSSCPSLTWHCSPPDPRYRASLPTVFWFTCVWSTIEGRLSIVAKPQLTDQPFLLLSSTSSSLSSTSLPIYIT